MKRLLLPVLIILLIPSGATATSEAEESTFSLVRTGRGLGLHKEMFIQPYSWSDDYYGSQSEVIFQLSAKHDLLGSRFFLAYSQISYWQAYDKKNSSPFRDTNYNPEVFYRFRESPLGSGFLGADLGFEHESNGQRVPLSRSWNLAYGTGWFRTDDWFVHVKARYRMPEDDKETPDSPVGDDNPKITDYLGHSDVTVARLFGDGHQLRLLVRGYVGTDKGLLVLTWSHVLPRTDGNTYACLRLSNGWGESLMDYNRHNTRIGIGIMFNR
ncbi:MAG: phospholipase A [bacterium]|nr:phospholipase A [bacterium]